MADDSKAPTETKSDTPSEPAEKANAKTKADSKKSATMHIRISSPFKMFFDDDAQSLSGVNGTGPFDILPHHHNFISLLDECELLVKRPNGDPVRIRISGGIMHVKADRVLIFLNV